MDTTTQAQALALAKKALGEDATAYAKTYELPSPPYARHTLYYAELHGVIRGIGRDWGHLVENLNKKEVPP